MNTVKTQASETGNLLHSAMTYCVIGLAMEVHNKLGAGFLEKVYENALMVALRRENIVAQQQAPIKIHFENVVVGDYVADILIDGKLILELKAVGSISVIYRAQVINYLKGTSKNPNFVVILRCSEIFIAYISSICCAQKFHRALSHLEF